MRVLVAGANGALGVSLTRLLVARGHSVVGLIRNAAGTDGVRALGAEPLVAGAFDRDDLLRAVNGFTADAVIHELAWQPRFATYREGIAAMASDLRRHDPILPRLPADRLRAGM